MDRQDTAAKDESDTRSVSVAMLGEMLASLQEAVVTDDKAARRALLKGVVAHLQDLLGKGPRA